MPLKSGGLTALLDPVPAHVWNLAALRQTHDLALEHVQAGMLAAPSNETVIKRLQAHADAEKGSVGGDVLADWLDQFTLAQVAHRVRRRADAGQDDHIGLVQRRWHGSDLRLRADALDRPHDGAQVARSIIEDDDVEIGQTRIAHRASVPQDRWPRAFYSESDVNRADFQRCRTAGGP